MELINYSNSIWSLFPPALALFLAVLTKRLLLSLGVGIVLGTLMLTSFDLIQAWYYLTGAVYHVLWEGGVANLLIIVFLLLLGMIAAFVILSGGSHAFGAWALSHIKERRYAKLFTVFLGFLIFIDDYFNSLAVGNISRPIADNYKISRQKLAYLVDSTAAPVCVLMPLSSWGAFIITLLATTFASYGLLSQYPAFSVFVATIAMNFYAIFALLMVIAVAYFNFNIGPMRSYENQVQDQNYQPDAKEKNGSEGFAGLAPSEQGYVRDLVIPFLTLIVSTLVLIFAIGYQQLINQSLPFSWIGVLAETNVNVAFVLSGSLTFIITLILFSRKQPKPDQYSQGISTGLKSMWPAICILLFAWVIIEVVSALGTGHYLAGLVSGLIDIAYLPALLFLLAGIIAFSTGSSWGTFGIMLPISIEMAVVMDISYLLPFIAAILSGAVWGDHCSPISDTTILSSAGAGCNQIEHVITQLPYALLIAVIALVGFLVLGFTTSVMSSLLASVAAFVVIISIIAMTQSNV